jgi:ABC-2 type transport system ATP-binding protein
LGERMKMELIASLLHSPKIVFLDEPTIGLDLTAQMAIRRFIDQYRKDHKPAMILTSHYMEDIEHLCERIIIIKEGAKVYDGPLDSVVKNHVKDRVITFICEEGAALGNAKDLPFAKMGGVEVLEAQFPVLKVKVPTMLVSKVIQAVMQSFQIRDIDLSEEDIANIIESMIRKDARK